MQASSWAVSVRSEVALLSWLLSCPTRSWPGVHRSGTHGQAAQCVSSLDSVRYEEEARALWQTSVPRAGQATTVQGELLRAVERLRDEAQRNGNINWGDGHQALIAYIRANLLRSQLFENTVVQEIETDLDRLSRFEYPETSDAPYDRLVDRVIEWCHAHPDPVPHPCNLDLNV